MKINVDVDQLREGARQIGARAVEIGVSGAGSRQVDPLGARRGGAHDDLGLDRLCGHDQQAGGDCDTLHLDSPPRIRL